MYDHCHVPTLLTRGWSRLLAARVDWMPMSSLNFCVVATEICLTLDNIGCTDITLEAARAHLQDDELKEVEGEELAGWADVTLIEKAPCSVEHQSLLSSVHELELAETCSRVYGSNSSE